MEFRDLAYFQVVAEEGHIGRAAERLGRTQPALSKCIRRLQNEIGAKLFARSGRGIQLTAVGKVLLDRSRSLHLDLQESLRMVSDFAEGRAGHIRIGTGATTAEYLLPQVLSSLLAKTPDITFEISVGMNDVLRTALKNGELDVVVVPLSPSDDTIFATHQFGEDVVVVAAAKDHPLVGRRISLADLGCWNWVLSAHSVATRQWLEGVFAARGLPGPTVQMQTNNISLMPRLIARTKLLSFISRRNLSVGGVGESLIELDVPEAQMRRRLGLMHRKNQYLPPAAEHLIAIIRTQNSDASVERSAIKTQPERST